ncbi:MAG: universal stress protein [bacterium]
MKKILLIVSFLRGSAKTVEEAMRLAREENAELIVFFVLDMEYADKIASKLANEGWIGGKPSEQLYLSLLKEYKIQAEAKIDAIERAAQQMNILVRAIIKSGAILDETVQMCKQEKPDLIVVSRRKRSNLSRFIFGSMVKALKRQANCRVKIIDAE